MIKEKVRRARAKCPFQFRGYDFTQVGHGWCRELWKVSCGTPDPGMPY